MSGQARRRTPACWWSSAEEAPVWICAYRGGILEGSQHLSSTASGHNELFDFLATALRSPQPGTFRLRGPQQATSDDGRWHYRFTLRGSVVSFAATEQIHEHQTLAYERILIGGLVGDGVAYGPQSLYTRGWTPVRTG